MCLKWGHFFLARRSRTNRGTTLALVLEASAHPSTKVSVVLEPLAHPSTKVANSGRGSRTSEHQGTDGVRGSRISEPPRCRRLLLQKGSDRDDSFIVSFGIGEGLDSSFLYILGCLAGTDRRSTARNLTGGGEAPTFGHVMGPNASDQQGPKLPMVLEAPAHLRHQGTDGTRGYGTSDLLGADGARGSGTSDRLGTDGARGSRTFEPLGCRCCSGHQGAVCGELPNMSETRTGRKLNKSPKVGSSHPHQQGPRCAMSPTAGRQSGDERERRF
ncbi:hypothetical protein GOBAR_DD36811 [Gossypium barbadense]|nr:hypothetical protein GOBAR_DD36811 [Gossypium barbadense]